MTMTIETAMTTSVNGTSSPVAPESAATAKKVRDSTKWLHKTKLCVYSIQGQCRLGIKCSFAHTASEVQDAPNLYKTQICDAFLEGRCELSSEACSFAHGEEELRLSPNFKNKLCKWFSKGKCRNGSDCGFAHGMDELRNPTPTELSLLPETGEFIPPPPGLSLLMEEAQKKERRILDLEASLLDEKAPPSLEQQVEGMSATIAALHWKMDEIVLRTQVSGMKQFLGQLSAQCAELEQAVGKSNEKIETKTAKTSAVSRTPLKTPLSSKATPFQPTALSSQASVFVPSYPTFQAGYDSADTHWPSDESGHESTSTGSGGGYSSD